MSTLIDRVRSFFGSKFDPRLEPIFDQRAVVKVEVLARVAGEPRRSMSRRLAEAGVPRAGEWVRLGRLLRAFEFAETHPDASIEMWARAGGFTEQPIFSNSCRAALGMWPTDLRGACVEEILVIWANRHGLQRNRFEEFLSSVIPREMPLEGKVDVRVARSLAWIIATELGQAGADKLELHAVRFAPISAQISADNNEAAAFVMDAVAFVRDQLRLGRVLQHCMEGASPEVAVRLTDKVVDNAA